MHGSVCFDMRGARSAGNDPSMPTFPDGAFRASEAVAAGDLTWSRIRGPGFTRLFPDIYVPAASPPDYRTQCLAAMLYVGAASAAVSGASAAALDGAIAPTGSVEITIGDGRRRHASGLVIVRSRLDEADIRSCHGVPTTRPERTVFDLARRLPRNDAVVAIDAMLHRHVVSVAASVEYAREHWTMRGSRTVTMILTVVDPLFAATLRASMR